VVPRWHAYRYLSYLLGYFRDVFQIDVSDEDLRSVNIKPKVMVIYSKTSQIL
jgi:hypothetical protein